MIYERLEDSLQYKDVTLQHLEQFATLGMLVCTVFKETKVMILNFQTDISGKTVQTQIRLFLEEQYDEGLHCLLSLWQYFEAFLHGRTYYRKVAKFSDVKKLSCNLPKIQEKRPNLRVFRQKDANEIANSEYPDQTAPIGAV